MKLFHIPVFMIFTTAVILFAGCVSPEEKTEDKGNNDHLLLITGEQFKAAKMELGDATRHLFEQVLKTNGILTASPDSKADVHAYISGIVRSIAVNPGTRVRKGQLLCTVQSKEYISMQQDYLESSAQLKAIEADYKRIKKLYKENISSQKDFLAIESEYITLKAKIESLKEEFKILQIDLKKLESGNLSSILNVLSPIDGYIVSLNCRLGEFIDSRTLLMKVVDNRDLQLYFVVYQESINKIKEGQLVKIYNPDDSGDIFTAKVTTVGKAIDPESKSIQCIAKPEDKIRKIFVDGMYFQVEVNLDTIHALALPATAIIKSGDNHYVLVKEKEDDKGMYFRKEEIKTGLVSEGFIQIKDVESLKNVLVKGAYYFQGQ